jgi:aminoglycoside phosphotransferase (APT) family kinase protein
VVRRPPLGHVLATAHDMAREYRVITALRDTDVPVPRSYALCTDPDVLGAPFYVMSTVDGVAYRTADQLGAVGPARARAIAERMVGTLALLHAVVPAEVGLADFGRPEGFLARQVRRWKKQLDASRSRPIAGIDELHALLAANPPDGTPPAIVHGDYRLDNAIVDDGGRIAAVLDWEMATLGDPLADLGLLCVYWAQYEATGMGALTSAVSTDGGFPSTDALVERYAQRSGLGVDSLPWYVAFGYFKLAVIAEGIHYRFLSGQTVGSGFESIGEMVPALVQRGLGTLRDGVGKDDRDGLTSD